MGIYLDRSITTEEIRDKLQKHYGNWNKANITRRLIYQKMHDSWGNVGSIFFSLEGSPPKGYALYISEFRTLYFYDVRGRRWQILENVWDVVIDENSADVIQENKTVL